MELFLARHGNTFNSGDPVVWVGSQNDLPLVQSGEQQAVALANGFRSVEFIPTAVYTGPLQRMTAYAAIILQTLKLNLSVTVDQRINEIDYGDWSGLTKEQVCQRFGHDAFENWEKHSIWPSNSNWQETAEQVIERIHHFSEDLISKHAADDQVLVVASNGCLRYFLDLVPGALPHHVEQQSAKIATGHVCKLSFKQGSWQLNYWNCSPQGI